MNGSVSHPSSPVYGALVHNALLFVHVPRCGGTSLTKLFKVDQHSRRGRCCYYKLGLLYFFYRYRLLEDANYPWKTWENLYGIVSLLTSTGLFLANIFFEFGLPEEVPYVMWPLAVFTMVFSTFAATAPVMGRNTCCRRIYAKFVGTVMLGFTASVPWLTGVNEKAWLLHLTAEKMLRYGYISREKFDRVQSFAVVRNPYSRMVSVYMYNKMGPLEPFSSFVRDWYKALQAYRERRVTDEWDIYCHCLPQHEYTHEGTDQLVQCIIKQELLPSLNTDKPAEAFKHLPEDIRHALSSMPVTNQRVAPKPWKDFYDLETRDLVLRMYRRDFVQFGYDTAIPGRPELGKPLLPPDEVANAPLDSALKPCLVNLKEPGTGSNVISLLGNIVPIPASTLVRAEQKQVSCCARVQSGLSATAGLLGCGFPDTAPSMEDLHLRVALSLRRRAVWLTIVLAVQIILYSLVGDRMWELCLAGNCSAAALFTIIASFHFLMVIMSWIILNQFTLVTAVVSCVSSMFCFFFSGSTFVLLFWRLPESAESGREYRVTIRILALVFSGLLAGNYFVFGLFYGWCARALRRMVRLIAPLEESVTELDSGEYLLNQAYLRWW